MDGGWKKAKRKTGGPAASPTSPGSSPGSGGAPQAGRAEAVLYRPEAPVWGQAVPERGAQMGIRLQGDLRWGKRQPSALYGIPVHLTCNHSLCRWKSSLKQITARSSASLLHPQVRHSTGPPHTQALPPGPPTDASD